MTIFLMAPTEGGEQGTMSSIFFIVLLFAVFYFLILRPQSKRQKELRKFRESLAKGDKVITTGGIHGKIVEIEEQTILLEVDTNVKIRIQKSEVVGNPANPPQSK